MVNKEGIASLMLEANKYLRIRLSGSFLRATLLGCICLLPSVAAHGMEKQVAKRDILTANPGEALIASYDFVWKGILVGRSNSRLQLAGNGYDIQADFETRGPLRLFMKGKTDVQSTGRLTAAGLPQPDRFLSDGIWGRKNYTTELVYGADGLLASSRIDWPKKELEKDAREQVPAALQTGPDPLSSLISFMKAPWLQALDHKASVQIFDGRSVYVQTLECTPAMLPLDGPKRLLYSGMAQECVVSFAMKAGFRVETEKEKKRRLKKEAKKQRKKANKKPKDNRIRVWFATLEGSDMMMPVQARFKTGWGTIKMYLATFDAPPKPSGGAGARP